MCGRTRQRQAGHAASRRGLGSRHIAPTAMAQREERGWSPKFTMRWIAHSRSGLLGRPVRDDDPWHINGRSAAVPAGSRGMRSRAIYDRSRGRPAFPSRQFIAGLSDASPCARPSLKSSWLRHSCAAPKPVDATGPPISPASPRRSASILQSPSPPYGCLPPRPGRGRTMCHRRCEHALRHG